MIAIPQEPLDGPIIHGDNTGTITGSYDDYAITCTIKKGESSLPDEKGGGSKTLTAINNNGDIDIEFFSE